VLGKGRRSYNKNKKVRRAESMSRKQAREHGLNHMVQWPCMSCGHTFFLKDLQLHHRDGDPHNNEEDCSNFALLCEPCHHKADAQWRKETKAGQEISEVRAMTGRVEAIAIAPDLGVHPEVALVEPESETVGWLRVIHEAGRRDDE